MQSIFKDAGIPFTGQVCQFLIIISFAFTCAMRNLPETKIDYQIRWLNTFARFT